jgi:hypothetical protein
VQSGRRSLLSPFPLGEGEHPPLRRGGGGDVRPPHPGLSFLFTVGLLLYRTGGDTWKGSGGRTVDLPPNFCPTSYLFFVNQSQKVSGDKRYGIGLEMVRAWADGKQGGGGSSESLGQGSGLSELSGLF